MNKNNYCIFVVLISSFSVSGQQWLSGRVLIKGSADIIACVNIKNVQSNKYNRSDMGGNYRIAVTAGDTIFFSSAGYRPDTTIVSAAILAHEHDVYLRPNAVTLATVQIDAMGTFLADSIRRREEYAFILDKKHPVRLMNEKRESDNPGFNFSPAGFFSKNEKQKRRLKQRLKAEEEADRQTYIDARFPRTRIAQLTRLTTDSLQQFMKLYRPTFEFCRNTGSQDMLLYINEKIVLFRQGKRKR